MHHMRAEGGRTRPRLDKFRRGGRPRKRYDNGGPAGSTAGSTRSADDPGGELATATRERKGALGRIQDELLGPKSAYKHGGRQRPRRYDDGGVIDNFSRPQQDVAPAQAVQVRRVQKRTSWGGGGPAPVAEKRPSFPVRRSQFGKNAGRADQTSAAPVPLCRSCIPALACQATPPSSTAVLGHRRSSVRA